ncbi:MAG: hypothetical protein MI741_05925 [Rhodospirillales bacterium]|nr:hypothetical protein [Rhodospirillales bacterium]
MALLLVLLAFFLGPLTGLAGRILQGEASCSCGGPPSVTSQLSTIRLQLELYQVQHQGTSPDLAGKGWEQLTQFTDAAGNVLSANSSGSSGFGPYFSKPPVNPITESSKVVSRIDQIGPDVGWFYRQESGAIYIVISPQKYAEIVAASNGSPYLAAGREVVVY